MKDWNCVCCVDLYDFESFFCFPHYIHWMDNQHSYFFAEIHRLSLFILSQETKPVINTKMDSLCFFC